MSARLGSHTWICGVLILSVAACSCRPSPQPLPSGGTTARDIAVYTAIIRQVGLAAEGS